MMAIGERRARLRCSAERLGEFRARNLGLFSGAEIFHREGVALDLFFPGDDHEGRTESFGHFEGFLDAEALIAKVDGNTLRTQFAGEFEGRGVRTHTEWGNVRG